MSRKYSAKDRSNIHKYGEPVISLNPILTQLLWNEVPYDHPVREMHGATGHKESLMEQNDKPEAVGVTVVDVTPRTVNILSPTDPRRDDWPHPLAKPLNKSFTFASITDAK